MKTLLRFSLLFLFPSLCSASSLLTQTARDVLAQSHDRARAEVFLGQAILENGDDPEPLALLAALRSGDLKNNLDELKSVVGPLVTRLLALREQDASTKKSDLALALEMNARFLTQVGQDSEATPLLARAALLRKQLVHESSGQRTRQAVLPDGVRVDADGTHPSVLSKTDPRFTEEARLSMVSGTVLISLVIDGEGNPTRIELVRGIGFGLDESAAETVSKWRFSPGTKLGKPVPVQAAIEVNFRLL